MKRFVRIQLSLFLVTGLLTVSAFAQTTDYWIGDGSANQWDNSALNWTNLPPGSVPTPGAYFNRPGNSVYADPNAVRFVRDTPADARTITVQAGGVSPALFTVDTSATWNFSGGLINAPLLYLDTSGGGSTLNFNGYTTSMNFSTVTNKGTGSSIVWNFAGSPGTYHFATGTIYLVPSFTTGATMKYVPGGAAGNYIWTDNFVCTNGVNTISVGGGATRTNIFSGSITLENGTLVIGSDGGSNGPKFTGTLTILGTKTVDNETSPGAGDGIVDWSGATITGGPSAKLTLYSSNANARRHVLPSTGVNFNVGSLTVNSVSVYVNATNAAEDYFATLRANGGLVTVDGFPSLGNYLYLQRGSFDSRDFVTSNNGRLVLDQNTSNENLTLTGPGGAFTVGGGSGITQAYVRMDGNGGNGVGTVAGNLTIGNSGTLILQVPGTGSDTMTLNGNLRFLGGSTLQRFIATSGDDARTVRLAVPGGTTLYLGDGSPATAETVTLRGGPFGSGGPNEAWGFNASTISDDGNVVLRYEMAPARAPQGAALDKYAMDWRDSSGTVVAFRGGSAGTIFAPDPSLKTNDGFVVRGPAAGAVFTAASPTTLITTGLLTFATNLANNQTPHTRGPVVINSGGSFLLVSNGTVRASTVTVNNGGTIGGIGRFEADVTVAGSGHLAPGNSAGAVTVAQNLTLQANAIYDWELGPMAYDGINVTSNLVLNSPLALRIYDVGGIAYSTNQYVLFAYNLGNPILGPDPGPATWSFEFMPGGRGFINTNLVQVTVDSVNNLVLLSGLQSLPEPGVLFLLAVGGAVLLSRRAKSEGQRATRE